jgi:uncharacterized BrkB/YihY/UPF0761 family membrane protein
MLPTQTVLPDNIVVLTVVGTAILWSLGFILGYWVYNDAKDRDELDEKRWAFLVGGLTAAFVIWGPVALIYYLSKRN